MNAIISDLPRAHPYGVQRTLRQKQGGGYAPMAKKFRYPMLKSVHNPHP